MTKTDRGTYCERQINAKLVVCAKCQKPYYFTDHQQTVCIACDVQRYAEKRLAACSKPR